MELAKDIHNPKFDLGLDNLASYRYVDGNETFSRSGFTLVLKRSPTPFFMNVYLPTALLTVSSFIGFLIPVDVVPGRMALLVTTFLMLVNMSSTERNRGPVVSLAICFKQTTVFTKPFPFQTRTMTSLDIWMLICMIFVAAAQFEYAMQLKIHFGDMSQISDSIVQEKKKSARGKCRKVDRYALKIFLAAYILTVGSYFLMVYV